MAKALDLFMIYQFLKRLVTPFEKWEAYKTGVIDKDGKVIVDKNDRDQKQKDSWGYYDRLLANLKKLLGKLPGGKSRLASFATALLLLKEQNLDPDDTEYLAECLDFYMVEAKQMLTEENVSAGVTNVVGGGKIAGLGVGPQGEPPVMTALLRRKKKREMKEFVADDGISTVPEPVTPEGQKKKKKITEGSESWEAGYSRRVVKTTKKEHKDKGYNWRIKGKDRSEISIKLYKEKPSFDEFKKQMKRVAGHEFGG